MSAYLIFLLCIIFQWIVLYPKLVINVKKSNKKRQKKYFVFFICIEMIIFTGLRSLNIGADTGVYIRALEYYKSLPHNEVLWANLVYPFNFEFGYFMLTKICAFFKMSNSMFLVLVSSIIYIPICKFIYKNSENPLMSILTYFALGIFGYSLGIFRQMIALSIVILAYEYVKRRNIKMYFLFVSIAVLFHYTAVIMLPFYWIANKKLNKEIMWVVILEILLIIFARPIILIIFSILPHYSKYINSAYDHQGGTYMMLIFLNIIFLSTYIVKKKQQYLNSFVLNSCNNALIVAIFLQILSYSLEIFGRVVPYYTIYLVILIPALVNQMFKRNTIIYRIITYIVLILLFIINIYTNSNLFPYIFIWE